MRTSRKQSAKNIRAVEAKAKKDAKVKQLTPKEKAAKAKKLAAKKARIEKQTILVNKLRKKNLTDQDFFAALVAAPAKGLTDDKTFDKKSFGGHREFCLYKATQLEQNALEWREKSTLTRSTTAKQKRLKTLKSKMADLVAELAAEGITVDDDDDDA